MTWYQRIRALFSGAEKNCFFVDAAGWIGNGRDQPQPREQLRAMQQLGRFAAFEKQKISVLWHTKPLRDVPDRSEYEGLTVHYIEPSKSLMEGMIRLAKGYGRSAVCVICNREQEQAAIQAGLRVMRLQNWQRAMQPDRGAYVQEEGRRDNLRSSRHRDQRRKRKSGMPRPEGGAEKESRPVETKPAVKPSGDGAPVSDLIDLI